MSDGPDYEHMENTILFQMTKLARNDDVNREEEFGKFITFLNRMHCTAVTSLAGAVLISTQMIEDKKKIPEMLAAVRKLVQATDADFSMALRSMILNMAVSQGLPDPFKAPEKQPDSH